MSTAPNNTLAVNPAKTLQETLKKGMPSIAAVAARHLSPDRIVKVAVGAAMRSPLLLQCTPQSFLRAVVQAVELGLEPGSSLGEAYLVPFRNKNGQYEAQMIPGYRGLIALARRSGEISRIEAHVVYERDSFQVEYGTSPLLKHVPTLEGNPGKPVAFYAVAWFKDGGYQSEVMTNAQVQAIKAKSKAANNGPWVDHYEEMGRKTVVKRLAKYLPLSVELARAVDLDNQIDSAGIEGGGPVFDDAIDVEAFTPEAGSDARADAIAERIGGEEEVQG